MLHTVIRGLLARCRPASGWLVLGLALGGGLLGRLPARAQSPAWASALSLTQAAGSGTAVAQATALTADGDVLVAGSFTGQVGFGATQVTSAGGSDVFVARYAVATNTWAWVLTGGGTGADQGLGLAVSGSTIYVTGSVTNLASGANAVQFGGTTLPGRGSAANTDLFLACCTDQGGSAAYNWAVAAGGTGPDQGTALAVGSGSVYVTGSFTNNTSRAQAAEIGGTALAGATATSSADVLLAGYLDQASAPAYQWAVVAGGTGPDQGTALAANGPAVYVAGSVTNNGAGANTVKFGGVTLAGASSNKSASVTASTDLFVARYTATPASAAYNWAVAGGGTGADQAGGLAVSGTAVYVTGSFTNTRADAQGVLLGGAQLKGVTTTSSADLLLARYTDATTSATFNWAATGGNSGTDQGRAVAVSGSSVYVAGSVAIGAPGNYVQFGSAVVYGTDGSAGFDALVARFDVSSSAATFAWGRAGGGAGDDAANALVVSSAGVQLGLGLGTGAATFDNKGFLPPSAAGVATLTPGGTWQSATATRTSDGNLAVADAVTNAAGDVLVTGIVVGQVVFNNQFYVGRGSGDVFVGKFSPATNSWVWLLTGGGPGYDSAVQLVVQGGNVYVAGSFTASPAGPCWFGSLQVTGVSQTDILLVKCVDAGSSASWSWATWGTGRTYEWATGLAVSGTSVYLVGNIYNNSANANDVYLCSTALPGIGSVGPNSFLAKYTDNGPSVTCNWATVAGSPAPTTYPCNFQGVAVSGSSVYVTGDFSNDDANRGDMRFAGRGVPGASPNGSTDAFLVKYVDQGTGAGFGWSLAIGGTASDYGTALAVSGSTLYLLGTVGNSASPATNVQLGGTLLPGANANTNNDVLLASFTDQGSSATLNWARADGGASTDQGAALAVRDGHLYVTGSMSNNAANSAGVQFGGVSLPGPKPAYDQYLFVARYTDTGSAATGDWALTAGSTGTGSANAVAPTSQGAYVMSRLQLPATFGSLSVSGLASSYGDVLAALAEPPATPLPVQLVAFTARPAGAAALLAWSTASEANSAYFAVERSPDGLAWQELGRVAAAGNSASARPYAYRDAARLAGPSYYRLRQADLDGRSHYSPVRPLAGLAPAGLALYPNPSPGAATLTGAEAGTPVQVLDATGRLRLATTAEADGSARLHLPAGLYLVRAGQQTLRLSVQ